MNLIDMLSNQQPQQPQPQPQPEQGDFLLYLLSQVPHINFNPEIQRMLEYEKIRNNNFIKRKF